MTGIISKEQEKNKRKQGNPNFKKGVSGNPKGRLKGSTNKFTDLKQAYLDVFDQIEKKSLEKESAIKSFFQWATKNDKNQGMFYQMVAKMLPRSVGIDGNIKHEHRLSMADLKKSLKEYNDNKKREGN